jgi:hypothetical protein
MGFRFRSRVRLLPGVAINLSKSGASLSLGGRGATVNFGPRGTRTTVGIPGTGISYSKTYSSGRRAPIERAAWRQFAQTRQQAEQMISRYMQTFPPKIEYLIAGVGPAEGARLQQSLDTALKTVEKIRRNLDALQNGNVRRLPAGMAEIARDMECLQDGLPLMEAEVHRLAGVFGEDFDLDAAIAARKAGTIVAAPVKHNAPMQAAPHLAAEKRSIVERRAGGGVIGWAFVLIVIGLLGAALFHALQAAPAQTSERTDMPAPTSASLTTWSDWTKDRALIITPAPAIQNALADPTLSLVPLGK